MISEQTILETAKKLLASAEPMNEQEFIALLESIEPNTLDAAITIKNNEGWTLLHFAANYQNAAFTALINKLSSEALNAAITIKDNYEWTPLHFAAARQNEAAFIALINKLSPETLNAAIIIKNKHGWTPLHCAAIDQNEAAFTTLIDKLSPAAFDPAITIKDNAGRTPLHCAARNQNEATFTTLIDKLSLAAFDAAIRIESINRETPLHSAALNQNETTFTALVNKLSPKARDAALSIKNYRGQTPFDFALENQSNQAIEALLPQITVEHVFNLIHKQDGRASAKLRQILSDAFFSESYHAMFHIFLTDKTIHAMASHIWTRIKQGEVLLNNTALQEKMLSALLKKSAFSLIEDEISLFRYLKVNSKHDPTLMASNIEKHFSNHEVSQSSMDPWILSIKKTVFFIYVAKLNQPVSEIQLTQPTPISQAFIDTIKNGETLIKIVTPHNYPDYLHQLQDYKHRPKLRDEINNAAYKLVHVTGKVVSYQRHLDKTHKPAYEHTKKSSTTQLGTHLKTPVFGQHDSSRPLVGYLFDNKQCVIKARLRQDKGTVTHQWLAKTEKEAQAAAHLGQNYNFTDPAAFSLEVNSAKNTTNEVLAKVKREAIIATVVARKDDESIRIAKERQQEALVQLKVDVPIVFYDATHGSVQLIQEKLSMQAPPQKLKI